MKLPRLIALHYGLAAVLLASPMAVIADAKNEVIDKQQKMTQEEMDATKKATPYNEQRPAANTSQSKHSTESPKGSMIKKNEKAVDKASDDAEAAKPATEGRPAVTTKKTSQPENAAGKALMESQKRDAAKSGLEELGELPVQN
jgi:cytoskeletal protein RodZ